MNKENITTLLFDLDGTLVDSAPDLALAVNQTLSDLNLATYSQDMIRGWVGNGATTLIERALSGSATINTDLDKKLADQALSIFLQHYQRCLCVESVLYVGVKETLITLKNMGFHLAVITNKPAQFIQPILTGLGLNNLFEIVIGGDSLNERKPHPLPLLHACEQLKVSVNECLMIGDSKNDILAAKAANIRSIGLTYGYNYGEDIGCYDPNWRLEQFSDLLPLLNDKVNSLT
jgi:phosphoglycolate phosphatase